MYNPFFSYDQARKTEMVEYLEKLGYTPQKIRNNDYWYLSPLREEKEPSFKVNRKLNAWYDHGLGRGGNIIDFGMLYHKCSYKELIEKLQQNFLFHPQTLTVQQHPTNTQSYPDALEPKIKVIAAKPLTNLFLCSYLRARKIPFDIAKKYCEEVHYEVKGKIFFAIGFKNNAGGYELRSEYFKGSSSPKWVTYLDNKAHKISVFEGFFDFLSHQSIHQNQHKLTNFLVLNSLSFFERSLFLMEKHKSIHLYLDQDEAGRKCTKLAQKRSPAYNDESKLYQGYKDLSDWMIKFGKIENQKKLDHSVHRHL